MNLQILGDTVLGSVQMVVFRRPNVNDTVDGRNPAHQLRLVVYPVIYKVLYIKGGARFLPSTVYFTQRCLDFCSSILESEPMGTHHSEKSLHIIIYIIYIYIHYIYMYIYIYTYIVSFQKMKDSRFFGEWLDTTSADEAIVCTSTNFHVSSRSIPWEVPGPKLWASWCIMEQHGCFQK